MGKSKSVISSEHFNFPAFKEDLCAVLKVRGETMQYASENVALRTPNYVSMSISKGSIHQRALLALAQHYGLQLAKYEIKPEPPKPEPKAEPQPETSAVSGLTGEGWENTLNVQLGAKIVTMAIYKDGHRIAAGRAKIYDTTDRGIVQAISYAAHMCYKLAEQKELIEQSRAAAAGGTQTGISSLMMVSALKPKFRSVTKQIIAIVNSPEKYGCCLIPEAEELLEKTFGPGPGLVHRKAKKRTPTKRSKGHAITIRIDDDMYLRLMSMKTTGDYQTTQALTEALLRESLERGNSNV